MHTQSEDSNSKEEKSHETSDHCAVSLEILEEKAPQSIADTNTQEKLLNSSGGRRVAAAQEN